MIKITVSFNKGDGAGISSFVCLPQFITGIRVLVKNPPSLVGLCICLQELFYIVLINMGISGSLWVEQAVFQSSSEVAGGEVGLGAGWS